MTEETTTESLVEEYLSALRRGESITEDAFAEAHPRHADELRELLPLLVDLEEYGRNSHGSDSAVTAAPPELPGSDYQPHRLLGRGGMGAVWEGVQLSLNRKIAVKVLTLPAHRKEEWRARFSREAQIVAQLHHPGIVKVYGAGTCGNLCYFAMELVEGTVFGKVDFPNDRAIVHAVLQAAQALAYAHRCGVVHRDIKPTNLMLDTAGEVRVTDFGVAAIWGEDANDEESRSGTLRYMAPERLTVGRCSFAVDQYALGVTLWELLTRRALFADLSGKALCHAICTQPVPRLTAVDPDLASIVAKSVSPRPEDRYADMTAFADDLRRWLDHETILASPPSTRRRLRMWIRRKPAMAGLTAAAAVCALAFAGALAIGYTRTASALRLAAHNADLADAALGEVFHHVEGMPPSRRDAELLSALLPYYGRLAGDQGLSPEKTAEVNEVLGVCALRSGDYALAEQAFRRLVAVRPSAAAFNRLAETLQRLGRTGDAAVVRQRVIGEYVNSGIAQERYESALALEAQGRASGQFRDRRHAFLIAHDLWTADSTNPDFRFLYARLLAESPNLVGNRLYSPEKGGNAFTLLSDLAVDYPERPEYGSALVSAMERRLRKDAEARHIAPEDLELALDTADRLLGRFPNVPDVVATVVSFRDTYAGHLRRNGDTRQANREAARTTGMLELLSNNAEAPSAARLVFKGKEGSVAYRQIVVGAALEDRPTTLILALHDRARNGLDNVRQITTPFLRTIVMAAEKHGSKVVIILPQCPGGREAHWLGAQKQVPDGLLTVVAELVRVKAQEFRVAEGRILAAGVDSGADAAWTLLAQEPDLFARALMAGSGIVPVEVAAKVSAQVRLYLGEMDRHSPPAATQDSVAQLGNGLGHPADVRVLPGKNHKALIDSAFDDEALSWFLQLSP